MKLFLFAVMVIFSISSFAAWNEVECVGQQNGKSISVEIEQTFPNGSSWKRALLTIAQDGSEITHRYNVTTWVNPGFGRVEYRASGFNLEVDFWPHRAPRWGMTYRGAFCSPQTQCIQLLNCRFPNAQ
jgi:hypothetical protein